MKNLKQSNTKSIIFAIIIGAVIIGGSVIYSINVDGESIEVIERNGEKFIVEADNPITLTIVSDENCEACDTEDLKAWLKNQLGTSLAIHQVDYASSEGEEILDQYEASYLPFLLLGDEVVEMQNISHLTRHVLTEVDDRYLVDLEKIGAPIGRYLEVVYYEKDDLNAPIIVVEEGEKDLGEVKLSEGKVQIDFTIRNDGLDPLVFLGLNSSCGCTSAKIVIADDESPVYQMSGHGDLVKWRGELGAGEEAQIVVFYDPAVHPELEGDVTREISVKTNDPNNPEETIKISVNQNPN